MAANGSFRSRDLPHYTLTDDTLGVDHIPIPLPVYLTIYSNLFNFIFT